jgi:hypothetical protein
MDARKIKIRIGSHDIELEGVSKEESDERLALFKELVLATSVGNNASAANQKPAGNEPNRDPANADTPPPAVDSAVASIFKVEGKTVSLITPPQGQGREGDVFLLLLWGHKLLRQTDWVLVGDVKAGLIDSGCRVDLVDNITATVSAELFQKKGARRGKQFRLLNQGVKKAEALVQEILTSIS